MVWWSHTRTYHTFLVTFLYPLIPFFSAAVVVLACFSQNNRAQAKKLKELLWANLFWVIMQAVHWLEWYWPALWWWVKDTYLLTRDDTWQRMHAHNQWWCLLFTQGFRRQVHIDYHLTAVSLLIWAWLAEKSWCHRSECRLCESFTG